MEIHFTKRQFETLMRLVYLGNWVVNGYRAEAPDEETNALENAVYSKARDFGLGRLVDFDEDLGQYFPSAAAEEEWDSALDDYRNDLFWDELEYRMADRDLAARYGEDYVTTMKPRELDRLERDIVDSYYEEFVKNGVKNLLVVRPS
jgi:hypothetical protein